MPYAIAVSFLNQGFSFFTSDILNQRKRLVMPLRAREGDFSGSSPASHNNLGAETAYKEANGWFLKKGYRWLCGTN